MSGVYGSVVPFFASELNSFKYYIMDPNVGSGFVRSDKYDIIQGVLHKYSAPPTAEGIKLRRVNEVLVKEMKPFFWTEYVLLDGSFIEDESGEVYRVLSENNWKREGDFTVYGLEKVVGDNGSYTVDVEANTGADFIGQ